MAVGGWDDMAWCMGRGLRCSGAAAAEQLGECMHVWQAVPWSLLAWHGAAAGWDAPAAKWVGD